MIIGERHSIMFIKSVKQIEKNGFIKLAVQTEKRGYNAVLNLGGTAYYDEFNREEPYDLKTHIFLIPPEKINKGDTAELKIRKFKRLKFSSKYKFEYTGIKENEDDIIKEYDSKITVISRETETVSDGVEYSHLICKDKNGAPVNAFTLTVDLNYATLYTGTAGDGYENRNVRAKVPEMIDSAVKNGVPVVAAVNGDFFDMFGDCHPSGLCVKNSRIIANPESDRPFIGIKKDGFPVITDITEKPDITDDLDQAVAGPERIVKDGKMNDIGPLEPFSYVRHPRTAAGITADNKVILLVVDGRIPEYSNGATLVDLAYLMLSFGAVEALNLDGGGSSIVLTKSAEGFEVRNNPADLIRPRAKLIRKEFNALLVKQIRLKE